MSKYSDFAAEIFERGFNCAQAVAVVFCDKYDVDAETAARAAAGFGGGLGCGEVCGALTGGVMAVGMRYGGAAPEDAAEKENCHAHTAEVVAMFHKMCGAVRCREMLGCDISAQEGAETYESENLRERICVPAVKGTVEILESLGY
jgi:C_GCAxxG_C_C family probable redox protein